MDDLQREKRSGLSRWYLKDVLLKRRVLGRESRVPGFGLAAVLFATLGKILIERLGRDKGEELIKEAVQRFGRERGRRIARKVASLGKPLSFKNWLIYTDIDAGNFAASPRIDNGDLVAPVTRCAFNSAAEAWGLEEFSSLYCKYADHAILEGYNPDIKLILEDRHVTGRDHCLFRYVMKEANK
ncbi:MAG: L-2-amino-thiazoline-4-carboxylic acid hydrolase [Deltaproteobacteria bacterium]|nr:L-2-amino-thiazoline-4-carboxylic acid hydrolase [Deltaproteobacteria bacterium]